MKQPQFAGAGVSRRRRMQEPLNLNVEADLI
jgi:hypothetical protein